MNNLIFDAHLDLSMNAMEWNRDLTQPLDRIRQREKDMQDKPDRGKGMVSFGAMREVGLGLCVATQIARYVPEGSTLQGWHSPRQAWSQTQGQLAWYKAMEEGGWLNQVTNLRELNAQVESWSNAGGSREVPIGYVLSLEGADSLVDLHYLEKAYGYGLRAIGPAHYGPGVYAHGTGSEGPLGKKGRELLREMESLGIILDTTHLCDESFWEALEHFRGRVWASHNNCRALVPQQRQFSDDQIRALVERGAVIGAVFDAWMLIPDWVRGKSTPENTGLRLATVCDHMDHICQLTGNCNHVGLGTDLDGAFGSEQSPADMESIADLGKLSSILRSRGYSAADVDQILWKNWLRFLREAWS
ncbi:MAG TPA: membrane dipeptidase [Chitinophagaceae bacterium]|nr:membrane dipeptidase [Chitinophagaceae bacterium]